VHGLDCVDDCWLPGQQPFPPCRSCPYLHACLSRLPASPAAAVEAYSSGAPKQRKRKAPVEEAAEEEGEEDEEDPAKKKRAADDE
jgi:hypothetical protein